MAIYAAATGVLPRDGEMKTAKTGKRFLRFTLRIGEGDHAQYVQITSFDEQMANDVARFVKGAAVSVEGSVRLDSWTAADGTAKSGLNMVANYIRVAEIGRNKPKQERRASTKESWASPRSPASAGRGGAAACALPDDGLPF